LKVGTSIVRRGNTYTIVIYTGKDEGGKKHYQWLSGFRTMKEARERQHEIESQQDKRIFIRPGAKSLNNHVL